MIRIEIKTPEKLNGKLSAFISFPYDAEIVNIMRNQPKRFWHADQKLWEISANKIEGLIKELGNREITLIGQNFEKPTISIPEGFTFKTQPFEHQLEGFEYGLNNDRFLLADEQGLGKTKQAIDIAIAKQFTKGYSYCLVICGVNGLKWNWQAEIQTHSNELGYILGTRHNNKGVAKIGSNQDKLEDLFNLPNAYFLIANVESLRDIAITSQLKKLCDEGIIGMVIIDEIHKCKNQASQQSKGILKLQPETLVAMTGTPLMNTPLDTYMILKWLGFEKHSFYQFKRYHCIMGGYGNYEIIGYRNLGELQENLSSIMIRRLKNEVLDLPDKLHSIEYVEMGKEQTTIYQEVFAELKQNIDKIKISNNPLTQLIRLRQATGYTGILSNQILESAKMDRLQELVQDLVANNQKAIIFSNWTDITTEVYNRLINFNPAIITGEIKDRQAEQDKFMNDASCKVIIGTIGAMGTGLTLTAASTVIFLDSPWNRALKEQAEDRAHRIGTKNNVNIITLVCKNTIDERIEDLINRKGVMADALVDGHIKFNKEQVVDFLLS